MEIQGSYGSKIQIKPNSQPTILGRGNGFPSNDLSISRRHISFHFNKSTTTQTPPTLSFEVLGKNPFWVYNKHLELEGEKIKSFKRFQRGELGIHDLFCVSPKNPVWFSLKLIAELKESQRGVFEGNFNDELSQSLENDDFELGFVDVSSIDPIKEFGFLVIRHEFDQYPKQMIREIKNWDWFLDDPRKDSDDDEDEEEDSKNKGNKGGKKKRKKTSKGDDDADEEWTAESEGEEQTAKVRKVQRPKYQTRSKDHGALQKRGVAKKSSAGTSRRDEEEEESEDEEDETLGGFIVDHNTTEEEVVENEMDEDEEEEFMDDEDELED